MIAILYQLWGLCFSTKECVHSFRPRQEGLPGNGHDRHNLGAPGTRTNTGRAGEDYQRG